MLSWDSNPGSARSVSAERQEIRRWKWKCLVVMCFSLRSGPSRYGSRNRSRGLCLCDLRLWSSFTTEGKQHLINNFDQSIYTGWYPQNSSKHLDCAFHVSILLPQNIPDGLLVHDRKHTMQRFLRFIEWHRHRCGAENRRNTLWFGLICKNLNWAPATGWQEMVQFNNKFHPNLNNSCT